MKQFLAVVLVLISLVGFLPACGGGGGGGGNSLSKDDIIVMLGNSLTAYGNWSGLLPNNTVLNYGVAGARASQILSRLSAALSRNPKVICIMGGINDLIVATSTSTVYGNLEQMVLRSKAQGVIVILQSTLHTGADYPDSRRINAAVNELNGRLGALASREGVRWLNLNSSMASGDYLKTDYLRSDNLHLSSNGYAVWADRLNGALP